MSKLQKLNSRSVIYTRWFSNKQQVGLISIFVLGMADTMSALFGLCVYRQIKPKPVVSPIPHNALLSYLETVERCFVSIFSV